MGGWILLAVVVIGALLIWRSARKRHGSGGARINNGPISRDEKTNYGNLANQIHGVDQRTNFTGGL